MDLTVVEGLQDLGDLDLMASSLSLPGPRPMYPSVDKDTLLELESESRTARSSLELSLESGHICVLCLTGKIIHVLPNH